MPRQLDQLPADATSLARRIAALEREVKELRAARRLGSATAGLIQTAASGARIALDGTTQALDIYGDDGETVLAELAPDAGGAGGGLWTRGFQTPHNVASWLGGGELAFRPVNESLAAIPAGVIYDTDGDFYTDLILDSGALNAGDGRAIVVVESAVGATPNIYMTGNDNNVCNLEADGVATFGNLAWGSVNITPSAANTPTSAAITGLDVQGSTFVAFASASTSVPGTSVTGVSTNGVSASGLTVWVTRTNTTTTGVNWLVIGV